MAEEKEKSNAASPAKGKTNDSLDQNALDQMLSRSTNADVDQLESMLKELEDPAEMEAALPSEEPNLDELVNNMEAMLNRMESGETTDKNKENSVSDLNDMLYQATLADVEQTKAESEKESDRDSLFGQIETKGQKNQTEDPFEALVSNTDQTKDAVDTMLENMAESEESEELDLDALLKDSAKEEKSESEESEELDLDALIEDSLKEEKPEPEELDLDALLENSMEKDIVAEEATEDDLDLDALLEDTTEATEELDLNELTENAEEESSDLDDLLENLDEDEVKLDEELNVGIEDEVAQILTGKRSSETGILDDFKSIQETILSNTNLSKKATGSNLLIVDADSDNLSMFKDALSGNEYHFFEVTNPQQALQVLNQHDIDLVLINLDDNTGGTLDLVETIVSNPELPSLPIIVNSEDNDLIEKAIRLGAVDYLTRPLGVMDIEFQVPQKVANQIRLRKAEHILAGVDATTRVFSTSPDTDQDETEDILDLDDLLEENEEEGTGLDDLPDLEDEEDVLDLDNLLEENEEEGTGLDDLLDLEDEEDILDLDDLLEENEEEGESLDDLLDLDDEKDIPTKDTPTGKKIERLSKKIEKNKTRLIPISDQEKLIRNRKEGRRAPFRLPLVMGIAVFLCLMAVVSYYAMDYFKDFLQQSEQTTPEMPMDTPEPKVKLPEVPKQDYAMSGQMPSTTTPTPESAPPTENTYRRQAEIVKDRIRQNVQNLSESGGTWWSPWRVMRESGASVDGLVNRRSVNDILNAFEADQNTVENGLQHEKTLNFLASVGFDLRGKSASDLTARETFELLSARQIQNADQLINILSTLTDLLADDRTAQAEHNEQEKRKRNNLTFIQPVQHMMLQTGNSYATPIIPKTMAPQTVAQMGTSIRGSPPLKIPLPHKT